MSKLRDTAVAVVHRGKSGDLTEDEVAGRLEANLAKQVKAA
jgi:hypothetical protein